jgi:hypothetical protein
MVMVMTLIPMRRTETEVTSEAGRSDGNRQDQIAATLVAEKARAQTIALASKALTRRGADIFTSELEQRLGFLVSEASKGPLLLEEPRARRSANASGGFLAFWRGVGALSH